MTGPGQLFVALRGERFDAHDFVAEAESAARRPAGASRGRIERSAAGVCAQIPRKRWVNSPRACRRAGRPWSLRLTGSNGKTSVKTLVQGILARAGRTYFNPGNRNNEIGLPLAVLDAPEDAQVRDLRDGRRQAGRHRLPDQRIAPPQVALVNNIAPAHMERMGSLLGIAETKGAIYEALPDDGVAVINADDAFAPYFADIARSRRRSLPLRHRERCRRPRVAHHEHRRGLAFPADHAGRPRGDRACRCPGATT